MNNSLRVLYDSIAGKARSTASRSSKETESVCMSCLCPACAKCRCNAPPPFYKIRRPTTQLFSRDPCIDLVEQLLGDLRVRYL